MRFSLANALRTACACALWAAVLFGGVASAGAQTIKPRFVLLIDTSGSMAENPTRVNTHGDGSRMHPGCDLDSNGKYDDSKMYQAKAALNDVISAFGGVEFALARYHQNDLGQSCTNGQQCNLMNTGANMCIDSRCANSTSFYDECSGGTATTNGCFKCADPNNDPTHVWYAGNVCCPSGGPLSAGYGLAGDVLVPFPKPGTSNLSDLFSWMDGEENYPPGKNKELRAAGTTPIGGSLNAVRDWLVNDASTAGNTGGALNRDDKIGCRSYNVILVTDGDETSNCVGSCGLNGQRAAELLYRACTNGGVFNQAANRCELAGSPDGTREARVKTYVVGFAINNPNLNAMAAAGGTNTAVVANNQAELTARLSDIVAASIPTEKCDCQDNTCDGLVDETFLTKGQACTVGVGRCKRQGQWACKPDGTGVICASTPGGQCPSTELLPGTGTMEVCGAAAGCEAPTALDCADDNCDGRIDENMSCSCASKPELCNGIDDDCNGKIDDVLPVACGLSIGECKPGITTCIDDGQGGKKTLCQGATAPSPELCDGKDNDCDGVVDGFGLGCYPAGMAGCKLGGDAQSCAGAPIDKWTCQGVCQAGLLTCKDSMCGACSGAITPVAEIACDKLDNDCDGETDEGFGVGEPCGPGIGRAGECKPGATTCADGALKCIGGQGPTEERCNGKDDDCDGVIDNLPGSCGPSRGECRAGKWRCLGSVAYCDQTDSPVPEACDGKDNDCNGVVDDNPFDPDLGTSCGTSVGSCKPGILRCVGGVKSCENGVQPERERCNGLDDDCDGKVDNGINPPGPCPAPGLPRGAPILGECEPGQNVCTPNGAGGAAFRCLGGVGPATEVCDGKDNDCDGVLDNGATCPGTALCRDGACVPACASQSDCPANRMCRDGACVLAECARKPCPTKFYCHPQRGCVSRCENVQCPLGTLCDNGLCTSCRRTGCADGMVCRTLACEPNPCATVACTKGQYCRNGACVKTCEAVRCDPGAICRDGACTADKCAGIRCDGGMFCDPKDGTCKKNACASIGCLPGQACVPQQAMCVPDPCLVAGCASDSLCVMTADGRAECWTKKTLADRTTVHRTSGGGGCSCRVGEASSPSLSWTLLALAVVGLIRRRRR